MDGRQQPEHAAGLVSVNGFAEDPAGNLHHRVGTEHGLQGVARGHVQRLVARRSLHEVGDVLARVLVLFDPCRANLVLEADHPQKLPPAR